MITEQDHKNVMQAAEELAGTPYALSHVSAPTPGTRKYVFQHTVALSPSEARTVIAEALQKLAAGEAEWTSGTRYGQNPGDEVPERWAELYGPKKNRRTRFTQSVGDYPKWVQQYYDPEIGNWFDIGDAYDTRELAVEAAVKRGSHPADRPAF